eukprot:scaffold24327_cov90-Isochrysis_galbana.AAC.1
MGMWGKGHVWAARVAAADDTRAPAAAPAMAHAAAAPAVAAPAGHCGELPQRRAGWEGQPGLPNGPLAKRQMGA